MSDEENKPRRVTFNRIVPQMKTFQKGTLLKNKVDLYYSIEEDIVETGAEDGWSPLASPGAGGNHNSFAQNSEFICKESTLLFVEAAQFRADDGNIYVRAQLLSGDKVVWVNVLTHPNRLWAFKIHQERKQLIKQEIESMFEILVPASG